MCRLAGAVVLTAISLGASGLAAAQQTCANYESAIDTGLKFIALEKAEGIGDNSAPRETNRQLKIANELAVIQANLALLIASKCPPPARSLNTSAYFLPAMKCSTARMKGEQKPAACELKDWKRDAP
jgi:hypothetical protein